MGERTEIAWTDHTFNPWIGCARVSPGCQHCYAETLTKRTGMAVWGVKGTRNVTSDAYWRQPLKWDRAAAAAGRPALVFCASLADVFEDRPDLDEPRRRLFDLIEQTPHLVWQMLTKRPEHAFRLAWLAGWRDVWPENVWIGTTVEDQQRCDERLPALIEIPARVRFLSCEPLLGAVDLTPWISHWHSGFVHWVIVGGESGPGHRPLDVDHARSLVEQCEAAAVPVFFKQVGGPRPTSGGDLLDGRRIKQFPQERVERDAEVQS